MIATKLKISNETRRALLNPVLTKKQKQDLRVRRVVEKIRSSPYVLLSKQELIVAAGYNPDSSSREYKSGVAFISNLCRRGIIMNDGSKGLRKHWSVVADMKVTPPKQVAEQVVENTVEKLTEEEIADGVATLVMKLAKDFVWETGSNDLHEFVASLSK